jgi:hypothetical protein
MKILYDACIQPVVAWSRRNRIAAAGIATVAASAIAIYKGAITPQKLGRYATGLAPASYTLLAAPLGAIHGVATVLESERGPGDTAMLIKAVYAKYIESAQTMWRHWFAWAGRG